MMPTKETPYKMYQICPSLPFKSNLLIISKPTLLNDLISSTKCFVNKNKDMYIFLNLKLLKTRMEFIYKRVK